MTNNGRDGWTDRTVLVTGIGGFVGGGLAAGLLARGATVVGVLRDSGGGRLLEALGIADRIELVHGSINTPGVVQRAINEYDVDTVFHLAAQAIVGVANRSPLSTFESNITGTWQVLEASRQSPTVRRVVVASSDKAYGNQRVLPYTEDTPLSGIFPYDASKVCTDVLARSYAATYNLPVAVTRCANIYGPGDLNWSRLIPGTVRAALEGAPPIIRSDGTPERDYLYLDDAVEGYLRVASQLPAIAGEAFNLGTGRPVSAADLVGQILRAAGRPDLRPRILGQAKGEIDRQSLASAKAARVLGWRPSVALELGLAGTVDWYRRYLKLEAKVLAEALA
jgi:CDP-glucose 4,6-dehydratase